jgi:hypothetical protein
MQVLESVFLGMFLLGFLFTLISAVMSGAFGHAFGEGSAFDAAHGAHPGAMGGDATHVGAGHDHGGHAEVGWADHPLSTFSPLSPTTISAFITAAGGMGYVAIAWWEWGPWASGALALGSGIVFSVIVFALFTFIFGATQGTSLVHQSGLVGVEGEVNVAIPSGGAGEVAYVKAGQRCVRSARCADAAAVPQGAKVVIKAVSTNEFVVEETRESWLARTRGRPAPA